MAAIERGKDRKLWTFGDVEMVSVISRRPEPQWGLWVDSPLIHRTADPNDNSNSIKSPGAEKKQRDDKERRWNSSFMASWPLHPGRWL